MSIYIGHLKLSLNKYASGVYFGVAFSLRWKWLTISVGPYCLNFWYRK